jgi:hypothetical protein
MRGDFMRHFDGAIRAPKIRGRDSRLNALPRSDRLTGSQSVLIYTATTYRER